MSTQNTENTYTKEQHELIADLCATYGLEPDQIVFFENDPEPIFDREATAILLHALTDVAGIEDDIVAAPSPDSVAAKYKVSFKDGTFAASTGVGTRAGTMTDEQLRSLAIGRAARSALRNKGINLLKLHHLRKAGNVATPEFSGPPLDEKARVLREVHKLGYETSLIFDDFVLEGSDRVRRADKSAWYRVLQNRYRVERSSDLNVDQLREFAAFLRTQLPQQSAA